MYPAVWVLATSWHEGYVCISPWHPQSFATSSCVSVVQHSAATCSPQLDNRKALGHSATGLPQMQDLPMAALRPSYCGKRQLCLRDLFFPRFGCLFHRTKAAISSTASHREGLWWGWNTAGEQNSSPVTHHSDKARGKWISAAPQFIEVFVDAPVRICLTNSCNLSFKFIRLFLHSRTPATAPAGYCVLVG